MSLPLNSVATSSLSGLQSSLINSKTSGINQNTNKLNNNSAYYAKKGEPMYMKEMDADEDGVVSFDEFRDYCKENDISPKQMVKMVEQANNYRTLQANEKASENISKNLINHQTDSKSNSITPIDVKPTDGSSNVYAKRGDSKYDEAMDANSDDKVTYKEYIDYCKEHAKTKEQKSDTKVEQSDDGTFKTSSASKAAAAYAKSEAEAPEGKYEYEA